MADLMHKVLAVIILDGDGLRLFSKYYSSDFGDAQKQRSFEINLFKKINKGKTPPSSTGPEGDVRLLDGKTVLFKADAELTVYVVGGGDENEIVLSTVLSTIYESVCMTLKISQLDKRTLLEHYDTLLLVIDECLDDGIILETVPVSVAQEVAPYVQEKPDGAMAAINSINKYLKQNL